MQRIMVITALLFVVLPFTTTQMRSKKMHKEKQAEQELIKMEQEFGEAQPRRDVAMLSQLMADEFTATIPPGRVVNKAQVIEMVASPDLEMESLINDEINVRVYGDAAVATGRGTGKGRYKGQDASGRFRYTRVWVKRGGQWQAVAAQSTMIEEK